MLERLVVLADSRQVRLARLRKLFSTVHSRQPSLTETASISVRIRLDMLILLEQINDIGNPFVDVTLIGARCEVVLVVDASKFSDPDRLSVRLPIVVDVGLNTSHIWLVDVDSGEIP